MKTIRSNEVSGGYCAGASCATEIGHAIGAVSGRWAVEVIEGLYFAGGFSRYRDLQRSIAGISSKELSRQLGTLVQNGIVARARCTARPSRIFYRLTEEGRAFMLHMQAMGEWVRSRQVDQALPAPGGGAQIGPTALDASWLGPLWPSRPFLRSAR